MGNNAFDHCDIGVSIFNGIGSPFDDAIRITGNGFEDADIAMQCSGVGGLDIAGNTINAFTPLSMGNNIGLFLRASAFDVRDNNINNVILGNVLMSNLTPGSAVRNNTFNNALIGVWAFGENTPDVQLSCNAFNFYFTSMLIQDFTHPFSSFLNEAGIFSDQGSCGGGFLDRLAGNTFNPGQTVIPDIISQIAVPFTYYTNFTAPYLPTVNDPALVNLQPCFTASAPTLTCGTGGLLSDAEIRNQVDETYMNREAVKKMLYYVRNDDKPAAAALLESIANDNAKRLLIPHYIETGDYAQAQAMLDNLPQNTQEEQHRHKLYTLYKNMRQSGRQVWEMNAAEETEIRTIAEARTATSYDAQALLYLAFGEEFPIELPAMPDFLDAAIQQQLSIAFKTNDLDETGEESRCEVYPNPARDVLTIVYKAAFGQTAEFVLYDLQGRELLRQKLDNSGKTDLSISHFPSGIYHYQITTDGKSIDQNKLVLLR